MQKNINLKIAFVADPNSNFVMHHFKYWQELGFKIDLVTHYSDKKNENLISAFHNLNKSDYIIYELLRRFLFFFEKVYYKFNYSRFKKAMKSEKEGKPSIAHSILSAFTVSKYINTQNYQFIIGFDSFSYGLAIAKCKTPIKVIQVWGGDIYMYAFTTKIAYKLLKKAFKKTDIIWTSSISSKDQLINVFKVPKKNIAAIPLGVDQKIFKNLKKNKQKLLKKYNIDSDNRVIVNIRRFRPAWGSEIALEVFINIAKLQPLTHFIFLGGAGVKKYVDDARIMIKKEGFESRFTFFEDNISMVECLELMSISDISTSFMIERDMRSLSISQSICLGNFPILSNQEEYKEMIKLGLKAELVDINNVESIINVLDNCLSNFDELEHKIELNNNYCEKYENWEKQHNLLINRIMEEKKCAE